MAPMSKGISAFERVAREHLKNLEDAGSRPSEIAVELASVANSYAAGGLVDEAVVLHEVLREYQSGRRARHSPPVDTQAG